ncbi:NACHT domain-containing protein [Paenibacillus glycinis]|uniref:ATP-binding protein n=1 Tax=Paenibacillus glycinis TaxID=2697035 RepID=A0ABW9XTF4_9BACL|nr:hypothetical protein [Paenibacillus glycinis]NBD25602.1 hypothetical protein [Paenibacillus glycinis]
MNDKTFSWRRFWCPRTGTINLSDGGYLYNPDSEYGHIYNEGVVPFEKISEVPCLILLGEPGIGKTEALKSIERSEKNLTLKIDLRSYGTEDRLVRNIFENPLFKACLRGEHNLHLFLDSLDECLLRIDYVAVLLAEEFMKYKNNQYLKNIFLRIACRTADWPSLLERELAELWGKDNIQIMELAPLRRVDVHNAAFELGIDADRFMNEIREKEVIPLAIKPITLKFLFNLYIRHGNFPSSQKELYLQGCELLCEETNESRVASKNTGSMRAKERLKVASRIAAMMVFSNKYAVWRDINYGDVSEEDITISDISGEHQKDDSLIIPESEIEETLSTGLFSSRGLNRFGWAHQTYAEFLAALYVTQNELSLVQVMSLIEHPLDSEQMLIPQLHEVSAWIATMNVEVFRQIIIRDPQVLLRSDVTSVDPEDKKSLVDGLLELYNANKIRDWNFNEYYYKLNHPILEKQIKPYIVDQQRSTVARRAAIRIARACKLSVLQDDLLIIALNPDEEYHIRIQASYTLCELANEANRRKLLPLAKSEAGKDADDELKGAALQALWPQYMSGEEIFSLLTVPKRRNFTGQYRMFLNYEILDKLQVSDLSSALIWVLKHAVNEQFDSQIEDLVQGILNKAGQYLEVHEVLIAFTNVIHARLLHFDNLNYIKDLLQNQVIRRKILFSLLNTESDQEVILSSAFSWLILSEDFPWMVEQLYENSSPELQKKWIILIERSFNPSNSEQVELLYNAIQNNKMLAEKCQVFFQSIPLDSEQATELKESHIRRTKWREMKEERVRIYPSIDERIGLRLDEFEAGDLDAWWRLNWDLGIEEENGQVEEYESDITALPGWRKVDIRAEGRILSAAKKYVLEKITAASSWFGTNTWHKSAMSGYRALRLVYERDYEFLLSLSPFHWENWSPVILTQWVTSEHDEREIHDHLVKLAYLNAPDRVISDVMQLIDKENQQHSNVFIIRSVKECWDARLGEAVLNKLKTKSLMPESIKCLLNDLLRYQIDGAEEFALSLIIPELLVAEESRKLATIAAAVLLNNSRHVGWDIVWSLKESYPDFIQDTFLSFTSRFEGNKLLQALSETALADFYIWLVKRFPHKEDPNHDNDEMAHLVEPREEIADFRDGILRYLSNKGTLESCNEIARIVTELPELSWLKWTLIEAQDVTRRNTWSPSSPVEIIQLVGSRQRRLVQSENQLLEVLIESLNRLEQKLHGITPAVVWLWNEVGQREYRPRSENEFSDYVKQHLEEDLLGRGIVVNREVEIRRSVGSLPGERTDIHVNALLPGISKEAFEVITVIIEVKGNWHRELFQAMETQLVNRYLKEGKCKYGLYLIGWFESSKWNATDNRKSSIPSCGLNATKDTLKDQAKSLSKRGVNVESFVMNLIF